MRVWLSAVLLGVLGLAGCAGAARGPVSGPSGGSGAASGETTGSVRQVSPEDLARLRAIDACQKEAAIQGFRDDDRRRRFLEACVARRGYTLPPAPETLQERENADLEWLQRFRQSP